MTALAAAAKPAHATTVKRARHVEELPSTTITIMRRVALGIALVIWSVAAFAGNHYNTKTLYSLKCHPYSSQAGSKSSLHTFGACRRL